MNYLQFPKDHSNVHTTYFFSLISKSCSKSVVHLLIIFDTIVLLKFMAGIPAFFPQECKHILRMNYI